MFHLLPVSRERHTPDKAVLGHQRLSIDSLDPHMSYEGGFKLVLSKCVANMQLTSMDE